MVRYAEGQQNEVEQLHHIEATAGRARPSSEEEAMLSDSARKARNIPADVDVEINAYGDEQFVTTNPERQYVVGNLWDGGTQLGWFEEHRTLVPRTWEEAHAEFLEDLTQEVEVFQAALRKAKTLTRETFEG